ncbi:MAG: 3-deoxy-D-manno-octulosonic acid transferase [Candidatus Tectomicrobia bacterium]|nr:3-deoxy-D-manno-octulosonic acid transferase [Candidatus Tectomicrobia bacterium]
MFVLYTLALIGAGFAALPNLLWRCLHGATYLQDFSERFGVHPSEPARLDGCLWFHAASVGEVQGLHPIIAALHDRFPSRPVVLSTFTPSGKAMAQALVPQAGRIFLLPFDLPWIVAKIVRRLRPSALIVQETELWPNLFRCLGQLQVPIVLVNGRISSRSLGRYALIRPFTRQVLGNVSLVLAQSDSSAQRFQCLGVPAGKIRTVGNTNIDRALEQAQSVPPHPMAPSLAGRRVLVAGSTHEGEEAILVSVLRRLREQFPDLCLILAPRHLERVESIVRQVRATGLSVLQRSQYSGENEVRPDVIVLDTLGELVSLYKLCTVAFVGGSLVPVGGHNILEPVMFGKPLLFGPHMHHFPELAQLLSNAAGAIQVRNEVELLAQAAHLLTNPSKGDDMGRRGRDALDRNSGALQRTYKELAAVLGCPPAG